MKTKIFRRIKIVQTHGRASLLLALLLCPIVLVAQNGVTVSNLAVDAGTVTFNVSWDRNSEVLSDNKFVWLDSVWVFVDYNDKGTMKRLPLSAGATLTWTSAPGVGRVKEEPGNDSGVWVIGNAKTAPSGSFSATVKLFTATADIAGACAYASNYPPVGKYISGTEISFTGTPMYDIVLKNGSSATSTWYSTGQFTVPPGYTVQSFSDKTGAPGTFNCISPAAPTNPSSNSRCGNGAVTFSATAPSDCTIDWYDAPHGGSTVTGGYGVTSFSPTLTQTASYYAQARNTTTGCVSSSRLTVMGTVNAVPTVTRSGGDASQTVYQNSTITTITYTASNATGIVLSSGSFPTGVTGSANGLVFTISGNPSDLGTFGYAVTASHTNGCAGATSSGTLTVRATTPPGAASTQTWTYDTQTWSDVIQISECATASFKVDGQTPSCCSSSATGRLLYYYNWAYVNANKGKMCPSPWRVPTKGDLDGLTASATGSKVFDDWKATGAFVNGSLGWTAYSMLWSSTEYNDTYAYYMDLKIYYWDKTTEPKISGMPVRCIK
jgi:hypothetical protein